MSPAVGAGQGWAAAGLDPARQRAAAAGKGGLCRQQMASAVFRLISPSGRLGSGDGNKEKAEKGTRCSRCIRGPACVFCRQIRSGAGRGGAAAGRRTAAGRAAWPLPGSRSRRGGGVQPEGRACGSTQSSAPAGRVSAAAGGRQAKQQCLRGAAGRCQCAAAQDGQSLAGALQRGAGLYGGQNGPDGGGMAVACRQAAGGQRRRKCGGDTGGGDSHAGSLLFRAKRCGAAGTARMDGGSRVQAAGVQSVRRRARRRRPAGDGACPRSIRRKRAPGAGRPAQHPGRYVPCRGGRRPCPAAMP